jgi:hypothetical protein
MAKLALFAAALVACGPSDITGMSGDGGAVQPGDAASAPGTGFALTSQGNGLTYSVSITIGGQQFQVITDTGSTTLGVAGASCTGCGVSPEYTPGASAVDQHTTSQAVYGDMSGWTAENYADTVALTGDTMPVTMKFGVMTSEMGFFQPGETDVGILGFAGSAAALTGTDDYVQKRAPGQFAFQLCPNNGTLWLGEPDASHQTAPPQFTPLAPMDANQPFYEIDVMSAQVGSTSIQLSGNVVADTGTSIMVLSSQTANDVISAIKAGGYSTIFGAQTLSASSTSLDCLDPGSHTRAEIDATLPAFSVTLPKTGGGSFTVTIPPSLSYLMPVQGMYCFGVVTVTGLPNIFGDAFLRAFVTTFDVANKQLGLAPEAGCVLPAIVRPDHRVQHEPWRIRGRPATE